MTNLERRRHGRRQPEPWEPISRMRLRTGRELVVLDVSSAGARVGCDVRLLPGTHVEVHVPSVEGRVLVRSRVARVRVASVSADRIEYEGALAFDRLVNVAPEYPVPIIGPGEAVDRGTEFPPAAA